MALDFYSEILGWLNQGTGNNNNSWGDNCDNSIFPIFEKAIAGYVAHAVAGGTLDLSGSAPPQGPTRALEMMQVFNGTLASDQTVVVPNLSKIWLVGNSTDGAFDLAFKTPGGIISDAIPQSGWALVVCDGADNVFVGLSTALRDVQFRGADGSAANPGLSFAAEPSLGIRRRSAGVLAFMVGGNEVATISATGLDIATGLAVTVGGVAPIPPGTEVPTAAIRAPSGFYLEYGQNVPRAGDMPLMNAITEAFTADTNSSTVLTNVSSDLRGLGLEGSKLEGIGMATGATIVSIDSASQITMSAAATNTAAGGTVRAFPFGNGDGVSTFTLPDARGTVAAGRDNMGGTPAGRLTSAGSGVNGLRLSTIGGTQSITLTMAHLPSANLNVNIPAGQGAHSHTTNAKNIFGGGQLAQGNERTYNDAGINSATLPAMSGTANLNGGGQAHGLVQPTRIRNILIKR